MTLLEYAELQKKKNSVSEVPPPPPPPEPEPEPQPSIANRIANRMAQGWDTVKETTLKAIQPPPPPPPPSPQPPPREYGTLPERLDWTAPAESTLRPQKPAADALSNTNLDAPYAVRPWESASAIEEKRIAALPQEQQQKARKDIEAAKNREAENILFKYTAHSPIPQNAVERSKFFEDMPLEDYRVLIDRAKDITQKLKDIKDPQEQQNYFEGPDDAERMLYKHLSFDRNVGTVAIKSALRTIPFANQITPPTMAEKDAANEHWLASAAGSAAGNVGQILATGGLATGVVKGAATGIGKAATAAQAVKGTNVASKMIRAAGGAGKTGQAALSSSLGAGAAVRTLQGGATSALQSERGQTAGAIALTAIERGAMSGISIMPEVFTKAGATQLITQPLFGALTEIGLAVAKGEDINTPEFKKQLIISAAMDGAFAVVDVANGRTFKIDQETKRNDVKSAWRAFNDPHKKPTHPPEYQLVPRSMVDALMKYDHAKSKPIAPPKTPPKGARHHNVFVRNTTGKTLYPQQTTIDAAMKPETIENSTTPTPKASTETPATKKQADADWQKELTSELAELQPAHKPTATATGDTPQAKNDVADKLLPQTETRRGGERNGEKRGAAAGKESLPTEPAKTPDAKKSDDAPVYKWGAEPIETVTAKVEEAKENVSEEQIQRYQKGASLEETVGKLHGLIDEKGTVSKNGHKELFVTNIDSGEKAALTKASVGKLVSGKSIGQSKANGFTKEQHLAAVGDIEDLFRNSTRIGSHPDKDDTKSVKAINRYVAPIQGDEAAYITERVTTSGERIYSLELIRMGAVGDKIRDINDSSNPIQPPTDTQILKPKTGKLPMETNTNTNNITSPAPKSKEKIKKVSEPTTKPAQSNVKEDAEPTSKAPPKTVREAESRLEDLLEDQRHAVKSGASPDEKKRISDAIKQTRADIETLKDGGTIEALTPETPAATATATPETPEIPRSRRTRQRRETKTDTPTKTEPEAKIETEPAKENDAIDQKMEAKIAEAHKRIDNMDDYSHAELAEAQALIDRTKKDGDLQQYKYVKDIYKEYSKGDFAEDAGTSGNEKRKKFDAMTPVEVSSDEVRALGSGKRFRRQFRRRVLDWVIKKDILGNYHNADKDWDIIFNNRSVRNTAGHNAGEGNIALLEQVPNLIKNGVHLETTAKADGTISHIFASKANIDGKPSIVGFVVREGEDGKRYYDHSIRLDEEGWAKPRTRESDTTATELPDNPNSVYNILKKHLGVNEKNKKVSADPAPDEYHSIPLSGLIDISKQLGVPIRVKADISGDASGVSVKDKETGAWKYIAVKSDQNSNAKVNGNLEKLLAHEIGHTLIKQKPTDGKDKLTDLHFDLQDAAKRLESPQLKNIYDELYALSKAHRPFDEATAPKRLIRYRQRVQEVMADAISVLLTDPAKLKRDAPIFYGEITGLKNSDTPFAEAFRAAQELAKLPPLEQSKKVVADINKGHKRKTEELAKTAAENAENAKKLDNRNTWWNWFMKTFVDWDNNLAVLVRNVKQLGGNVEDARNPYLMKNASKYTDSYKQAYEDDVKFNLKKLIGEWDEQAINELGAYMQLNRVTHGDRVELVNAFGKEEAARTLDDLPKIIGQQRFDKIKAAAEKFAALREEYLFPVVKESKILPEKTVEKILNNPEYATFDVVKELKELHDVNKIAGEDAATANNNVKVKYTGDGKPIGAHKQTGTTSAVGNAFVATLMNDMQMLTWIDRNNLKKATVNLLINNKNTLDYGVKELDSHTNKKTGVRKYDYPEKTPQIEVNGLKQDAEIVSFLENGQKTSFLMSKDIAQAISTVPKLAFPGAKTLNTMGDFYRNIFVQKNPGFWIHNIQRDFKSFHFNIEQGTIAQKAAAWLKAAPEIAHYLKTGEMSEDLRNAFKDRAMLARSAYSKNDLFARWDADYDKAMQNLTGKGKYRWGLSQLKQIGEALDRINDVAEMSSKLAGYKIIGKDASVSRERRAQLVRTKVGTPDIHAGGLITQILNKVFLFSNMNIQGTRESLTAIKENPTRAAAIATLYNAAPILTVALADNEKLTELIPDNPWIEWLQEAYQKIPRRDKVFRQAVPLPFETPDGLQFYFIMPRAEMSSTLTGIMHTVIDGGIKVATPDDYDIQDELATAAENIFADIASNAGMYTGEKLLPPLQIGLAAGVMATGHNPTDFHKQAQGKKFDKIARSYRYDNDGEPIDRAGAWADFGTWAINKAGASIVYTIKEDKWEETKELIMDGDAHWFEKLAGLPIIGPGIGRVIRVSDAGLDELQY